MLSNRSTGLEQAARRGRCEQRVILEPGPDRGARDRYPTSSELALRQKQCCFARRSTSDPRATQCLLRPAAGRCEQVPAPPHDPRGIDQSSSQSRPRRVVAVVKADVDRPGTGRAQRHACDHGAPAGATITFGSRGVNAARSQRRGSARRGRWGRLVRSFWSSAPQHRSGLALFT